MRHREKIPELHVNLLIEIEIEHIYNQRHRVALRAVPFNNIRTRNTCDAAFIRIV